VVAVYFSSSLSYRLPLFSTSLFFFFFIIIIIINQKKKKDKKRERPVSCKRKKKENYLANIKVSKPIKKELTPDT
jgi:hypothetical protein